MGRMTVTKLQVDTLVQAAVYGPMGATHWEPLTKDPDELGRQLLSSGRRGSGERNAEDYVFAPLPIALTAVEVIKACGYYRYQRAKTPAIVQRIARAMEPHLDGWDDAPWGWESDDTTARLGRPAPGSDLPATPPPAVTDVADRLVALGMAGLEVLPSVDADLERRAGGTGSFHGQIGARYGHLGDFRLRVLVATSPQIAARVYPHLVGRIAFPTAGGGPQDLRRIGNLLVLVWLRYGSTNPDLPALLDQLGTPDEQFSPTEPPLASTEGGLVAGQADLRLPGAVLARTARELAQLLEHINDADLRERLRGVDLRHHSVLAVPGRQLDEVAKVELVRSGTTAYRPTITEDLVLTAREVEHPRQIGSIVLVPRLRRRPAYVRGRHETQDRYGGWWMNVWRLG
jgi:hypothetical protein